jgi:hypothetical protein
MTLAATLRTEGVASRQLNRKAKFLATDTGMGLDFPVFQ